MRWLPPFVVGVSAATAAEIAAGLLLYMGPGMMRSLTLVLAVQAGALGVGLWNRPETGAVAVSSIRRRWLLCMVVYLGATLFSVSWSLIQEMGSTALTQGLGLAFLSALPLYACGSVLGAMASAAATEPSGRLSNIGAPAALGAAFGFVATGVSLPQVLTPASLFLVCLVLLSAGGLVYGSVLDARLRVEVRSRRPSPLGDVRVEDRHLPLRDRGARFLFEGGHLRRWMALEEADTEPWDVSVFRALHAHDEGHPRILVVGGGASSLPRVAVHAHPHVLVDVVERSEAVVALACDWLNTALTFEGGGRIRMAVGNPEDLVAERTEAYDLVVVDTAALGPVGGVAAMTRFGWATLARMVAHDGIMALGSFPSGDEGVPTPAGWVSAVFERPLPEAIRELGDRRNGGPLPPEIVVLAGRRALPDSLPTPRGFVARTPEPAANDRSDPTPAVASSGP